MKPIFNKARVEQTATFVADELKLLLSRDYGSHVSRRISGGCPAYKNGLTNGELLLATLRALSMVQLEISADLGSLITEPSDWEDLEQLSAQLK